MRYRLPALAGLLLLVSLTTPADAQRRDRGDRQRAGNERAERQRGDRQRADRQRPNRQRTDRSTTSASTEGAVRLPLESLRVVPGGTFGALFADAACDPPSIVGDRSLCNNENVAAEFERRFEPLQSLETSLRVLVDLDQISRSDARAFQTLAGESSEDARDAALEQLMDSPLATSRVMASQFSDAMNDDALVSSSTSENVETAAAILGGIAAGAATGAAIGAGFSGVGAPVGAALGAAAATGFMIGVILGSDSDGDESGKSDDDDEDGGTTDQEGESGPGLPGEEGGGTGQRP